MPATGRNAIQRRYQPRHQCPRNPQVAAALPRPAAGVAGFCSVKSPPSTAGGSVATIELPLGEQTLTVKCPTSDPEGCARFVRGLPARVDTRKEASQFDERHSF